LFFVIKIRLKRFLIVEPDGEERADEDGVAEVVPRTQDSNQSDQRRRRT
jgi:hypothetical protein